MSKPLSYFVRQRADALSVGISIVRKALKEHPFPNGFTTKELFAITQKYPPPPDFAPFKTPMPTLRGGVSPVPNPEHPIRSVRFLKVMVLPALEGQNEVRTVAQPKTGVHSAPDVNNLRPVRRKARLASPVEFVWKVVPPEERKQPVSTPTAKPVVGKEVGVGADISHLNPRRQRARVRKVTEAVLALKDQIQFTDELSKVARIKV